jgi:PncC family amidohydrolase
MNLIELAHSKGLWLCAAESLTAGLVASGLASLPGASKSFIGAIVAYQDQAKSQLLGVSSSLIANQSAVDPEVAAQLATAASHKFALAMGLASDKVLAVSTTGVAGPDSVGEKRPGEVYLAVARGDDVQVYAELFQGDRDEIRRAAVTRALALLREHLEAL